MPWWRHWLPAASAFGCAVLACLLWAAYPPLRDGLRETTFDAVLPLIAAPTQDERVVVVDIDRESLARHGAWPWSRLKLAALLEAVPDVERGLPQTMEAAR